MIEVLEIRAEVVIAKVNGNITTRPNTPYYNMKYSKFENRQISYTFNETCFIRETFDDRIFNCWCEGKRLTLRQDLSDSLMMCIENAEQDGSVTLYKDLFIQAYNEITNTGILNTYLRNYKNVKQTKDGFVIHGIFKIDYKGNAYLKKINEKGWNSLCIVMQGSGHSSTATSGELPDREDNMVEINAITMTILSKVLFLLEPEIQEEGFIKQLPEKWQILLSKAGGGDNVW